MEEAIALSPQGADLGPLIVYLLMVIPTGIGITFLMGSFSEAGSFWDRHASTIRYRKYGRKYGGMQEIIKITVPVSRIQRGIHGVLWLAVGAGVMAAHSEGIGKKGVVGALIAGLAIFLHRSVLAFIFGRRRRAGE